MPPIAPLPLFVGLGLMLLGLVGLAVPVLPGMPLIIAGAAVIAWADGFTSIGIPTLALIVLLGVLGQAADWLASLLGAKKAGASNWGLVGAVLGLVVGLFFGLPGVLVGPLVGAVALEYTRDRDFSRASKAGAGVLVGFLVGTAVKYAIGVLMIGLVLLAWLF